MSDRGACSHAPSAALARGRNDELTCLVLKRIQRLSSLCNLGDVFPHDADGVVDLGLYCGGLWVRLAWACGIGGACARKVRVVWLGPAKDMNRVRQRGEEGTDMVRAKGRRDKRDRSGQCAWSL